MAICNINASSAYFSSSSGFAVNSKITRFKVITNKSCIVKKNTRNSRLLVHAAEHPLIGPNTGSKMSSVIAFDEIVSSSSSSSSSLSKSSCLRILLIHGILGCGDDFADFCHSLASSLSIPPYASFDWRMVVVDLRNHGRSVDREGLSPPHDLENAARDVANLVKSLDWVWPDVVIGHSLGGKVALQYALSCARGDYGDSAQLPKQLWVLEAFPGKSENKSLGDDFVKALHTLQTVPSPIPSQEWLVDHLTNLGVSKFRSEWIGSTLKKSGQHMTIPFNIDGVIQMFKSVLDMDYWTLLEHPPKGIEIGMVFAETWGPNATDRLESLAKRESDDESATGKVSFHVVPRSGHWIFKDQPQALLEIMIPRMASLVQPKL